MRIFIAGATGVLGRATMPHLSAHEVVGMTRTAEKLELLQGLGVEGVVCDVYDAARLSQVVGDARPGVVVNLLTDLSRGPGGGNNRVRREGSANLRAAAEAAGATRLVVESVAFPLKGDGGGAVAELESSSSAFSGDVVILRFGRLWGPGTFYEQPAEAPTVHVARAGAEAAGLIVDGSPGTHLIT